MMYTVEEKMIGIFVSMVTIEFAVRGMAKTLVNPIIEYMSYMTMLSDQFLMSCLTVKHLITNIQQMNGISIRPPRVLLPL